MITTTIEIVIGTTGMIVMIGMTAIVIVTVIVTVTVIVIAIVIVIVIAVVKCELRDHFGSRQEIDVPG